MKNLLRNLILLIAIFHLNRILNLINQHGSLRRVNFFFNLTPCTLVFIVVLENGTLTNASDIWSFAILLWELFTRRIPFVDLTPMQCGLQVQINLFYLKIDLFYLSRFLKNTFDYHQRVFHHISIN
jgi:hypothetical protein